MEPGIISPRIIKEKKKGNKLKWFLVIFFGILLAGGSFYASYHYFNVRQSRIEAQEKKAIELNQTLFTIGANYGYSQAVEQVFSKAKECDLPVPITFNNKTINIISIECLNFEDS